MFYIVLWVRKITCTKIENTLNIITANVRGLVKNYNLIEATNLSEYDVLMFNEIWQIKEYENVCMDGFKQSKEMEGVEV